MNTESRFAPPVSRVLPHPVQHVSQRVQFPAQPRVQTSSCAPSGAFALLAGQALTLRPEQASMLRISRGAAWVTLQSLPGDHFLRAGEHLRVQAGDHVVMEAWRMPAQETLYFDWDTAALRVTAASSPTASAAVAVRGNWLGVSVQARDKGQAHAARPSYCAAVLAPLADLRSAVVLGAGALGRLGAGLLGWSAGKTWDFAADLVARRAGSTPA